MTPLRDAAESATAGVPVVRGLEWFDAEGWWQQANTVCGNYVVGKSKATNRPGWYWRLVNDTNLPIFPTEEEAKAAAQADYEQRIRSALNPDFLSELDTARAEIERLTRERDELVAWFDGLSPSEMHDAIVRDKARIAELVAATDELLGDWPPGELPRHATAVRVAKALNAARATLSPAVKEPK